MRRILQIVLLFILIVPYVGFTQTEIPSSKEFTSISELWLGTYTKYRIKEKWFYYGEYHLRRRENLVSEMGQAYLRFGVTHIPFKNFEVTTGIVTPFYWSADPEDPTLDRVVPQFRFWEQALIVQPLSRGKLYHQFRFEQRWRRSFTKGSDFDLTYRWRYKIQAYIPLNSAELGVKTLYLSTYNELIMQSGKTIVYNHFEDYRAFLGVGYIINSNMQIQTGYQFTYRHAGSPYVYQKRHIPRISFYHSLDFTKSKTDRNRAIPLLINNNF